MKKFDFPSSISDKIYAFSVYSKKKCQSGNVRSGNHPIREIFCPGNVSLTEELFTWNCQ